MRIETDINPLGEWQAWDPDKVDGAEDAGYIAHLSGTGKTEQEAIADYMESYLEHFAHDANKYRDALLEMGAAQMQKDRKRIKELEAEVERLRGLVIDYRNSVTRLAAAPR